MQCGSRHDAPAASAASLPVIRSGVAVDALGVGKTSLVYGSSGRFAGGFLVGSGGRFGVVRAPGAQSICARRLRFAQRDLCKSRDCNGLSAVLKTW
jgi:hypothetical protein